jgi:uncharacterized metal-binding protein
LRIGVKYCGGCNPGYDRSAAYAAIRDGVTAVAATKGAEVSFEPAREGELYDALLVLCGCANRCANVAGYAAKSPYLYVWNEAGIADVAERLAAAL